MLYIIYIYIIASLVVVAVSNSTTISYLFMQHLEGALIQRLQQRREHVEAPRLHGQLALRVSLEGGQVVVELGVLLGQGHVFGYIALRDRVVVVVVG